LPCLWHAVLSNLTVMNTKITAGASVTASADTRYSFTGQFLEAATLFARRARLIEGMPNDQISEELRSEHRGVASAALMQCAAALETEAAEICVYGPGSYLGSNGTDHSARRFEMILHLLQRPALDKGREPYQSIALVVRLRNEITHYKSKWGQDMELFTSLKALRHTPPPFIPMNMNFFPHQCLSADLAAWAVNSTVAFLDAVYDKLGVPSRFETYRARVAP
jgi:hypothetical protein